MIARDEVAQLWAYVRAHVHVQVGRMPESLAAKFTQVRRIRMNRFAMKDKSAQRLIRFVARGAAVIFSNFQASTF
jgi:hypothetical protein